MVARSSLLRRPTPGARPARRTSSVVAALAALAPRLARLPRHDYPDGLLRMEVKLALLADGANVSREGKLNLLGIFDTLFARSFPTTHPQMQLVIRFEAAAQEAGSTRQVEIQLVGGAHRAAARARGRDPHGPRAHTQPRAVRTSRALPLRRAGGWSRGGGGAAAGRGDRGRG